MGLHRSNLKMQILAELKTRFPDHLYQVGEDQETIAIFPAVHPSVGNVTIFDDGDEATVFIEKIFHFHSNPYDDSLSERQRNRWIVEDIMPWLEAFFDNKMLLWRTPRGSAGSELLSDAPVEDWMESGKEYFVWTGPIERP